MNGVEAAHFSYLQSHYVALNTIQARQTRLSSGLSTVHTPFHFFFVSCLQSPTYLLCEKLRLDSE